MNPVGGVKTQAVDAAVQATTETSAPASDSLLPPPSVGASTGSLGGIYALMLQLQEGNAAAKKGQADANLQNKKVAEAKQLKAETDAEAKQKHASGLAKLGKTLGVVAGIAAIVGSVALAVCTYGAGTPFALAVAGAVLSSAAFAEGQAHVCEKLGMSKKNDNYVTLGLSLGSAICSGGAGAMQALAGGAEAASTASAAGQGIGDGSTIVSGTTTAARGYTTMRAGEYEAGAERSKADAAAHHAQADAYDRLVKNILRDLQAAEKEDRRQLGELAGVIRTKDATLTTASMRV